MLLFSAYSTPLKTLEYWREMDRQEDGELLSIEDAAAFFELGSTDVDASMIMDPELIRRVPEHFAKTHLVLPLATDSDGRIRVAVATPFLGSAYAELVKALGGQLVLTLAHPIRLEEVIDRLYTEGGVAGALSSLDDDALQELENIEDLKDMAQAAPVIKLVNNLFLEAIRLQASDIHISAYEDGLEARYRVDGVLRLARAIPRKLHAAIISRLKIISNLDIAERRVPQDGRIRLKLDNRDYDIRVAVTPTVFGEGAVMRILDKSSIQVSIEDVGFSPSMQAQWLGMIKRPNGVALVTGPTGSGKTTTLYASLNYVLSPSHKYITVEDPVEYQLRGVDQIQVNTKAGLTFASALRSILRQDPDVIMIGEIRDAETAEIAIQSALTGHLVFSTLHTNDAPSAVTRLVEMGIEPYLVASTLGGVLAQRLVRRLHQACKTQGPDGRWRPQGCPICDNEGFKGRLGVFQLLSVTEELRGVMVGSAASSVIAATAQSQGMRSLYEDGLDKVASGQTTEDEIRKVAMAT